MSAEVVSCFNLLFTEETRPSTVTGNQHGPSQYRSLVLRIPPQPDLSAPHVWTRTGTRHRLLRLSWCWVISKLLDSILVSGIRVRWGRDTSPLPTAEQERQADMTTAVKADALPLKHWRHLFDYCTTEFSGGVNMRDPEMHNWAESWLNRKEQKAWQINYRRWAKRDSQ